MAVATHNQVQKYGGKPYKDGYSIAVIGGEVTVMYQGEAVNTPYFSSEADAKRWIDREVLADRGGRKTHRTEKSLSGFCRAVADARSNRRDRVYLGEKDLAEIYGSRWKVLEGEVHKAAMGETSGQTGGYLLPTEYTTKLLVALSEHSFIYPRANVFPMGAAATRCPKFDQETAPTTAGIAPWFGGVTFTVGYQQAPTEVIEPNFREMTLQAWDLLGYGLMSNQWLQDTGTDGEEKLIDMLAKAAAWYSEYLFLNGTGAAALMPLGIIKSPALKAVTRAGGSHIAQADVAKMWAALIPSCVPNAIWSICPTAVEDLVKITGYSPNNGNVGPSCGTIYTRPVFITDKQPVLGEIGDILLFDPTLYAIGMRQEAVVDISADQPTAFQANQSMFRLSMRFDGKPQLSTTITMQDTSTVCSAYVALSKP